MCERIDIAEDRSQPHPVQGMGSSYECEGWYDDLALQVCCFDGDFEGNGAVTGCYAVAHVKFFRNYAFKLLNIGTVVGQPLPVEQIIDAFQQTLPVAGIRASDVQCMRECLPTSEKGQVAD